MTHGIHFKTSSHPPIIPHWQMLDITSQHGRLQRAETKVFQKWANRSDQMKEFQPRMRLNCCRVSLDKHNISVEVTQ